MNKNIDLGRMMLSIQWQRRLGTVFIIMMLITEQSWTSSEELKNVDESSTTASPTYTSLQAQNDNNDQALSSLETRVRAKQTQFKVVPLRANNFMELPNELQMMIVASLPPKHALAVQQVNKELSLLFNEPYFWRLQLKNLGKLQYSCDLMERFDPKIIVQQIMVYHKVFMYMLEGRTEHARQLLKTIDPSLKYIEFQDHAFKDFFNNLLLAEPSASIDNPRRHSLTSVLYKAFYGEDLNNEPNVQFIQANRSLNADLVSKHYKSLELKTLHDHIEDAYKELEHYDYNITLLKHKNTFYALDCLVTYCNNLDISLQNFGYEQKLTEMHQHYFELLTTMNSKLVMQDYFTFINNAYEKHSYTNRMIFFQAYVIFVNNKSKIKERKININEKTFNKISANDPIFKILTECLTLFLNKKYDEALNKINAGLETYPLNTNLVDYKKYLLKNHPNDSDKQNQVVCEFIEQEVLSGNNTMLAFMIDDLMGAERYFKRDIKRAQYLINSGLEANNSYAINKTIINLMNSINDDNRNHFMETIHNMIEYYSQHNNNEIKIVKIMSMIFGKFNYPKDYKAAHAYACDNNVMPFILNIRPNFSTAAVLMHVLPRFQDSKK